jgi:hypothetical protein
MKKLILSLVILAASTLSLSAARSSQNDGKNVSVTGTEVVKTDANTVGVSFQVQLGGEVTASNRSLIIRPMLVGAGGQSELPPIIVRGARSKVVSETAAMAALGIDAGGHYLTSNGTTIEYWTSVPLQDWMVGSQLIFSGLNTGKGDPTEVSIGVVAENLLGKQTVDQSLLAQTPAPVVAPAPVQTPVTLPAPVPAEVSAVWSAPQNDQTVVQKPLEEVPATTAPDQGAVYQRPLPSPSETPDYSPVKGYYDIPERQRQQTIGTIGDELAARFTFVEPASRLTRAREASSMDVVFDYNMPLVFGTGAAQLEDEPSDVSRFVEMTREGAAYFKFERGSSVIDRDLGENNTTYVDLISSIRVLENNPETNISQIIVVGFSAPEGILDEKEMLAMERAGVARDFLTANTRVNPDVISIYNGSVDWVTLRELVSNSNMPEKYKVLEIIDNVPAWSSSRRSSRIGRLMELNGGEVFTYMRQYFFPQLRQTGAYVKVYYENVK